MTHRNEVETFRTAWNAEAKDTLRLLEALPTNQYAFRPDPKGRSIGEMASHLSEIDACLSFGIALRHLVHHRAQLVLLCRQAGGTPPGFYGPNREEMQEIQAKLATATA